MSLVLISSERFVEHQTPPGHPERPERAEVMDVIAERWRARGGEVVVPRAATHEQLARVHDEEYLKRIAATSGQAVALDPDTFTSPESHQVALLAAGAAVAGVDRVMGRSQDRPLQAAVEERDGRGRPLGRPGGAERSAEGSLHAVLALVRPPGHHAERNRAMGFCLYNNIAVAAAQARALGAGRVAIVDYDVHHGNGTQHTFESDPNVLYVSTHQFPFYPGTGAADEVGRGDGRGFTVNVPLEAGAVDDDYRVVFERLVVPVLQQFKPDLLLVSAGFDAHQRDPLGGMRLTTEAFAAMTSELARVAEKCCEGRMALVTEGSYDLRAFAASLDVVTQSLASSPAEPRWPTSGIASDRGRAAVDAAKRAIAPFWDIA